MQKVIEQLRRLSSAEDCPRFFDIALDEKVVNVSHLHTLKRFFQHVEQQKELPCNNATAVLAVYRCLLQKADNHFIVPTPAEQKEKTKKHEVTASLRKSRSLTGLVGDVQVRRAFR
ncbi:nitrogenase-stabilizing/protective protein NifW [Paraburkholderia rhynchosiae]|uniref:Nitrogenase-stabilizing/protective protein NifW n=1 Tax=Paraburkholderia rhynchosiae TaxID=487049 RepID=A0A2N7WVZ7_9BURK|nr:nitrogenase-stabilizing/protective protein NifW [Paraburkholderia rhynchosiae]PMS33668.1 nitrogen fixation protein NifW [Paraburkholderia rhynchosiae]CAB3671749.1 Nitrogenase-stabilizing/protective protein NifW [Paraburkholderia rhynchosiae]